MTSPRLKRSAWLGVLVLAGSTLGCDRGPQTVFESTFEPRILSLRTYEGSGQVVHPDVIRVPAGGIGEGGSNAGVAPGESAASRVTWGPYWMAITPYPFSREKFENPSIYWSADGFDWVEPRPALNPIVPRPRFDHNCDPDLVFEDGSFVLTYLETQRDEFRPDSTGIQKLQVVRSPDGITWKPPETFVEWDLRRDPLYLSPCLVRGPEGWRTYLVWPKEKKIVWLPTPQLASVGPPQGELVLGLPGHRPWHLDIFPARDGHIALLCSRGPNATSNSDVDLWIGASRDLETWSFREEPLLKASPEFFDTEDIYRSTGLEEGGQIVIWFSAKTHADTWFLGVMKCPSALIDDLFAKLPAS